MQNLLVLFLAILGQAQAFQGIANWSHSSVDVTPAAVNWTDITVSFSCAGSVGNIQTISSISSPITLRITSSTVATTLSAFYRINGGAWQTIPRNSSVTFSISDTQTLQFKGSGIDTMGLIIYLTIENLSDANAVLDTVNIIQGSCL